MGVIGIDHNHIHGMVEQMSAAGAMLVSWCTGPDTPAETKAKFAQVFPDAVERPASAILEDPEVGLILSAAVCNERADIAIAAMRHGKDVFLDKPGCTTLSQLEQIRAVVAETGRIWSIYFSERFSVESATLADRFVSEGRIGTVVQTLGFGPHRLNAASRPGWFWQPDRAGGILTDICAHQFDQFLHFTGSREARVVSAHVGNVANPDRANFQDFGEALLAGDGGRGYARVDWLTPDGLPTWGDGRLTILGTEGYIELRKYIDIAGQPGKDHVFLVDGKGVERFDATGSGKPFFAKFLADIRDRTQTAMPQAHAFLATQLALEAQALAERGGQVA